MSIVSVSSSTKETATGSTTSSSTGAVASRTRSSTSAGTSVKKGSPSPLMHIHEHKGNPHYRKAILQILEQLRDFHSKSNLDLVMKGTKAILEDHNIQWKEVIFVQTLRNMMMDSSSITQKSPRHTHAELSDTFKKKRAQELQEKLKQHTHQESEPVASKHRSILERLVNELSRPPARKQEHNKWKIMPRKIYDRTRIVQSMDTR